MTGPPNRGRPTGRVIAVCFLLLSLLLSRATSAEEPRDARRDGTPPARPESQPIDSGYVFIDGKYVSAPYLVEDSADGVTINGVPMTAEMPRLPGPGRFGPPQGWRGGRGGPDAPPPGNRTGFGPFGSPQSRIVYRLRADAVLVAFEGRPLVILEVGVPASQFLRFLINPNVSSTGFLELLDALDHHQDRELWTAWLSGYRPPEDLLQRANAVVQAADAIDAANQAQIAAVRRIDRFSYPLSVLGMVLAVLASGHLLSSIPAPGQEGTSESQPIILRAAAISVALVFFLSALDLAWTILAAQAGQMRELNPLGNGMIDDPYRLIAFKSSATLLSCGLLLALRRHHFARKAAWWLCLVCTILAFRWLAFNSLFMGS